MQKRSLKFVAPLAMVSAAALAICTGLASASGASTGSKVNIYEADTALAGNLGTVVLTGAITDSGTDCQGCAGGDGLNLIELSKGTFEVNVSDLGNELAALPVNRATCSSDGSATAPVQIVPGSGTGAYTGISGTFYTWGATAAILPKKSGACETSAAPTAGVLIVKGSGAVSYHGNN